MEGPRLVRGFSASTPGYARSMVADVIVAGGLVGLLVLILIILAIIYLVRRM